MGKKVSFDIRTPDPENLFITDKNFKRGTDKKAIGSIVETYIAHRLSTTLDKEVKEIAIKALQKPAKQRTSTEKSAVASYRVYKSKLKEEVRSFKTPKEKKAAIIKEERTVSTKGFDNNEIPFKLSRGDGWETQYIIAKLFSRIISRTPYDEDYTYSTHLKAWKYNKIRTHYKDDDVVREEWYLKVVNSKGNSVTLCSKDLLKIADFESIKNEDTAIIVAIEINKTLGFYPIRSVQIWNTNPRVDMLEFGRYEKKTNLNPDYINFGENRPHGTYNGYSVQAPRGFIALSISEFDYTKYEEAVEKAPAVYPDVFKMNLASPDNDKIIRAGIIKQLQQNGKIFDEKDIIGYLTGKAKDNGKSIKTYFKNIFKYISHSAKKEQIKIHRENKAKERQLLNEVNNATKPKDEETTEQLNVEISTDKSTNSVTLIKKEVPTPIFAKRGKDEDPEVVGGMVYITDEDDGEEIAYGGIIIIDKGERKLRLCSDIDSVNYQNFNWRTGSGWEKIFTLTPEDLHDKLDTDIVEELTDEYPDIIDLDFEF